MSFEKHPVITKDYPENTSEGVMICGINFGYSKSDERIDQSTTKSATEQTSFFSDISVNKTRFRNSLLTWLSSWGIDLSTNENNIGTLERSFFQTNWLNTQTNSITSDGAITPKVLVRESGGLLGLLIDRRPMTIIFVGSNLIQALNDISLRERIESILGPRSGNAEIHHAEAKHGEKKFKVLTQSFGKTQIIGLPHVQSRGLTNSYMAGFKPILQNLIK